MKIIIEGTAQEIKEFGFLPRGLLQAEVKVVNSTDGITSEGNDIVFRYKGKEWRICKENEKKADGDEYFTYGDAVKYYKKLKDRHLPSIEEWRELLKAWCEYKGYRIDGSSVSSNYKKVGEEFAKDFNIEFAGYRDYYDAKVYGQGYYARLWSSSPDNDNYARNLYLYSSDVSATGYNRRASGLSVRCFKNSF